MGFHDGSGQRRALRLAPSNSSAWVAWPGAKRLGDATRRPCGSGPRLKGMGLQAGNDGMGTNRPVPAAAPVEAVDRRLAVKTHMATGTLACPRCDAPVALTATRSALRDSLGCPFCGHGDTVRAFLSLAEPSRPARVRVTVRRSAARAPR